MRKKFTMLFAALFLVMGSAWAQMLVTSVAEGKYYTLQCNSTSHSGFLGENESGLNGQSAKPTYLIFETTEGGYHVKSALTGKYLNQGVSIDANKYDVAYSATASTIWTIGKLAEDASDIYLTIGDTKFYLNNNKGDGQKLQILKHDAIGTGNACSLWEMREHEGGYKVIESIGENITSLDQLTDGSYVVFYNAGCQKYIYEGLDHKLWMGTSATAGVGHEYIWRVRKEGDKYAFMAMSGRYFSTPLDNQDVSSVGINDAAKDEFIITVHNEDDTKWKLQSTNNPNIYWDAQDGRRFVGWQGRDNNSKYEIKPVVVKESEHALAEFITADENIIKWVNIKNERCDKYAHYEGESIKMSLKEDKNSSKSYFYLTGEIRTDGHLYVKIHNYRTESLCNETNQWNANGREWTIQASAGEDLHPGYAITKGTDLGNNGLSWNNEGGSGTAIAYWNGNDQGSTWAFEKADYHALLARLENMKTTILTPAITAAQTAYEAGQYTETAITLTAEQLYCNAPYTAQNNGDNAGVGALVDGNDNTYLHTDYSGAESADYEDHYIRVDLGENSGVKYFTFNYKTRHNADGNNPRVIVVEGADTENGEYYEIATLTEADGLPITGQGASYKSHAMGGHAYRYVRFKVTDTNNHSLGGGGHKFFSLASFGLSEVTVKEGSEVKTLVYSNMPAAIAEVQSVYNTLRTTEEDINSAAEKLNIIVEGLTVQNYPFTLTTDINHPVCYHIKSGRSKDWSSEGVFYWTFIDGKITTITSDPNYKKDVEAYWFFMENPKNGQLQFVPFIEHTKPMGYTTVTDGADKITNNTSVNGFVGAGYTLVTNTTDSWSEYPYALKPYGGNTYVSNNGGKSGKYMGFWNGHADGGTRFALEEAEIVPSSKLRDLRTVLATCPVIPAEHVGTAVGLYNAENYATYAAFVDPAREAYNDATLGENVYFQHLVLLDNDPKSLLTVNAPQVGKFYRLKNIASNNYIAGNDNDVKLLAAGSAAVSTIFYLGENNTLLAYKSGRYLDCSNKTYSAIGTPLNGEFGFAYGGPTENVVTYKNNGAWTYGAGADGAGLDRGTGTPNHAGYNWTFEEVTWLPVAMNTTVGYATLYSPVELELSFDRVKAYTVTVDEEKKIAKLNEQKVVPANAGVVLELQENAEVEDGHVFLQVKATENIVESDLVGSFAKSVKNPDAKVYTLQCPDKTKPAESTGFYLFKGTDGTNTTYINGFRAWVELDSESPVQALRITRGDEEGTTGIESVELGEELVIFDLAGRRVQKMEKGIYIVNGKKVVIK